MLEATKDKEGEDNLKEESAKEAETNEDTWEISLLAMESKITGAFERLVGLKTLNLYDFDKHW